MGFNPALHPRNPRNGRFTKSFTRATTRTERRRAERASAVFSPARRANRQAALSWHAANATPMDAEQRAAAVTLLRDRRAVTNTALRTPPKDTDPGDLPEVAALDSAMTPLTEDVLLTRRVSLSTFQGVDPGDLVGRKVRDAGYSATSIVPGGRRRADEVRMKIKAPAGTPAILVPDDPDGQVILPRDLELVIESATPDGRGGWDMTLVALPGTGTTRTSGVPAVDVAPALPEHELIDSGGGAADIKVGSNFVGAVDPQEDGWHTLDGAGAQLPGVYASRDEAVRAVLDGSARAQDPSQRPGPRDPGLDDVGSDVTAFAPEFEPLTGPERKSASARIMNAARRVMEGRTYGNGFTVEVDGGEPSVLPDGRRIATWQAKVMKDGKKAGSLERTFTVWPDGTTSVNHTFLKLNKEHRRQRFASDFNARMEEYYREQGIDHITIHAALEDGGYVWAHQGFQPRNAEQANKLVTELRSATDQLEAMAARMRGRAESGRASGGVSPLARQMIERQERQVAAARAVLARAEVSEFGQPGFPRAEEIADAGRGPDDPDDADWPGKSALRGLTWYGIKKI